MKNFFGSLLLLATAQLAATLSLDTTDTASIKSAASTIAYGLIKYYTGNVTDTTATLGILPKPYYWWEAGALWGAMLDYYHYTGDTTYNSITTQALLSQVGPDYDYMVAAQQYDEGNDDQAFWGFATMSAAEKDYPQPTVGQYSWGQLTENLWNTIARRWNTTECNGGLKWQIFSTNSGYNYKNSIANGAFFQLSARLARFTGNQTYADWAEKVYEWTLAVEFIDNTNYLVYDGASEQTNCSVINHITWTYNTAVFMYGSAAMYNYTSSSIWQERTQNFLDASKSFFSPFTNSTDIMYEAACETVYTCNNDQYSFKAYLSRFMWASTQLAPFTTNTVKTLLTTSAQAASKSCSGGTDGVTCGTRWYVGGWDGQYGVGQQMSALETIQGLLVDQSVPPLYSNQVHVMVSNNLNVPSVSSSVSSLEVTPVTTSPMSRDSISTVSVLTSSALSSSVQASSIVASPSLVLSSSILTSTLLKGTSTATSTSTSKSTSTSTSTPTASETASSTTTSAVATHTKKAGSVGRKCGSEILGVAVLFTVITVLT